MRRPLPTVSCGTSANNSLEPKKPNLLFLSDFFVFHIIEIQTSGSDLLVNCIRSDCSNPLLGVSIQVMWLLTCFRTSLSLNVEYDRRHHFLLFQVFVRLIMLSWGVCIVATSAERQQLLMKPLVAICFVFTTLNFVTCLRHNNASADSLGFSVS